MVKKIVLPLIIVGIVIIAIAIKFAPQAKKVTKAITNVVLHKEDVIKQTNDHTNVLLLGIGGGTHDGPKLTDSIIFASIGRKDQKVTLVSIPRDLWVAEHSRKINSIYSIAEDNEEGSGLQTMKDSVSTILGQPVHYGFRIDFAGFTRAIDEVDGLDIDVERTFDDYAYPIEGKEDEPCGHTDEEIQSFTASPSADIGEVDYFPCRYEHVHFDKGNVHMDGTLALKYVRSRHANGPEGTDFARSRRQSKVINGFKQKVFSLETFLNPARVLGLFGILKDSIDTDIPEEEIPSWIDFAQKLRSAKINSTVLDQGSGYREGLLTNPPSSEYGGAWVLAPKAGAEDYSDIQKYVVCEIVYNECNADGTPVATPSATIKPTEFNDK